VFALHSRRALLLQMPLMQRDCGRLESFSTRIVARFACGDAF
jgi:hypothetical protein